MLKKLGLIAIIASSANTIGMAPVARAEDETPADTAAFQRQLEKGDPMDPDYRFKRDTAAIYAACESNWFIEFPVIRDCYRNGMEEIAKGTQFADLVIKSCEFVDRKTPDLIVHPIDWDATACFRHVAEVTHYPKLKAQVDICEKWYFKRWKRADCLFSAVRGIEDGEETRPKSDTEEMVASVGGHQEKGTLKIQKQIPDRSYMDNAKVAALIGACKATNTTDTADLFGKLMPNPNTMTSNAMLTDDELKEWGSSAAQLLTKAKTGAEMTDDERHQVYAPHPEKNIKLELTTPKQPDPVHVDWSNFKAGDYNFFTAKHDWSSFKSAGKDVLHTTAGIAGNMFDQVTSFPYVGLVKKTTSLFGNPMPTSMQEADCYRDGLKAIGQGKDLRTMLLEACTKLWPMAGDQKNKCLRAGMLASNLSDLVGGAKENCDKNKFIWDFTGDVWHFANGFFGTSCYEDVLVKSHQAEAQTQRNQSHVTMSLEKEKEAVVHDEMGDHGRDAAKKYMGNKLVNHAAERAYAAQSGKDSNDVQY